MLVVFLSLTSSLHLQVNDREATGATLSAILTDLSLIGSQVVSLFVLEGDFSLYLPLSSSSYPNLKDS
jgi:hypothetical protein